MEKRDERTDVEASSDEFGKKLTRRELVVGAGAVSAGLLLSACGSNKEAEPAPSPAPPDAAPSPPMPAPTLGDLGLEPPLKEGLAEGMYSGPTGFPGAEALQYPFDSEEGRAIFALRRLRQDGKAPDTLRVVHRAPEIFREPFTQGAPSHAQLFEEETGIRLQYVQEGFLNFVEGNRTAIENQDGSADVILMTTIGAPDLVDGGLIRPLDDFVEIHQPSWRDPEFGYMGGEPIVDRMTTYRGETTMVPWRNPTPVLLYRADLVADPAEQAAFEDRYGRELRPPVTWDEEAEVAEFFHRPNADPPLYGSTLWFGETFGMPPWHERFVSAGNPNEFFFNDDGEANLDNDAGLQATEELLRARQWTQPNNLDAFDPALARDLVGSGRVFMTTGGPGSELLAGRRAGLPGYELVQATVTPGRIVNGGLVSRPNAAGNLTYGVNAFAEPARHEAAYLFLQWLGGARVNAWVSLLPGFVGPLHVYALKNPLL